jgi:hypothetical protein
MLSSPIDADSASLENGDVMTPASDPEDDRRGAVARFPQSRVRPPGGHEPVRELGMGALARQLAVPLSQTSGHWCSQCRGIWYGQLLEVACPVCGNRQG